MIRFYFYNSYQMSCVGYQLTAAELGAGSLSLLKDAEIDVPEIASCLLNSGTVCAVGQSGQGLSYMALKGLSVAAQDGRGWYINMAVCADETSKDQFVRLVRRILMRFDAFLADLPEWFYAVFEGTLSYGLHFGRFRDFVLCGGDVDLDMPENGFWGNPHPAIQRFRDMLAGLSDSVQRLYFLVPESTEHYFYVHNPVFEGCDARFVLDKSFFDGILFQNPNVFEEKTDKNASRTKPKSHMIKESAGKISAAELIGIAALALAAVVCLVKGLMKNRR